MDDRFTIPDAIEPETEIERRIIDDPEWQRGVLWGVPRPGHPEGQVINHVRDVLANIDDLPDIGIDDRERLRLIALLHDACKAFVRRGRTSTPNHGMLARRMAERFLDMPDVLDVIELHDEAYACWRQLDRGQSAEAHRRARALLDRVDYCLDLYLVFYRCDTMTGDKDRGPLDWFEMFCG
jgi:HD domain